MRVILFGGAKINLDQVKFTSKQILQKPDDNILLKKLLVTIIIFTFYLLLPISNTSAATISTNTNSAAKLNGRIVLETESFGRPWYISPTDNKRWYLKNPNEMLVVAKSLAKIISSKNLELIATANGGKSNASIAKKFRGLFVKTKNSPDLWYINPADSLRYPLNNKSQAQNLLQNNSLPVKDKILARIPMNAKQIMFDPTFRSVTYAKVRGKSLTVGWYANTILPIASLTKLMTALVILDSNIDWNKPITITPEIINYPNTLVGDDATSEVDIKTGDVAVASDLWDCMLMASSNQAAVALADATGLTREEFVGHMNAKAKTLGLKRTAFYDMTGLDSHNVSTAKEMGFLAKAAFAVEKIVNGTNALNKTFNVTTASGETRSVTIRDRNTSLRTFEPEAAKVGYLTEAQRNVVLKKNGNIIIVLHANSMKERNKIIKKLIL